MSWTDSPAHQLQMALSSAGDAIRAIDLQAYRVRQPDTASGAFDNVSLQRETETRFLLVALRWLYRACDLAADLTGDAELRRAIDTMWHTPSVGEAKDMRDVWEHLDAYIAGRGRLQRAGRSPESIATPGNLRVHIWTGAGDLGSLTWAGLSLSLDEAVIAAHRVYRQTATTVSREGAAMPPT
jgi:hypothetical protein